MANDVNRWGRKMLKEVTTLALIAALTGCVSVGTKIDQSRVQQLQKGTTTYTEAVASLGPPTAVTVTNEGKKIAVYSYAQAQARPESFVPLVGPFIGGADAKSSMVMLTFDANGVLQEISTTEAQTSTHY